MKLIDADAEIEKIEQEIQRALARIKEWEDNREDRGGYHNIDAKIERFKSNINQARAEIACLESYSTAYDVDNVVEQLEKENAEMREAIRKLLCSEYGSSCEFCIQDSNDNAKCRKVGGSGSWCCENAAYDNEWNKRQVE